MNNPFDNIEKAFEPMITETIIVKTKKGHTQSLRVFVSSVMTDEPFTDEMMDTQIDVIQILCRKGDWLFVADVVKRGDEIFRPERQKKYVVSEVKHDEAIGLSITAKSK